jgi:hypothetical protein
VGRMVDLDGVMDGRSSVPALGPVWGHAVA